MTDYRLLPAGDTALSVEFGDRIDRQLSDLVLALARRLGEAKIAGVIECVPTFRSLMIYYDPLLLPHAALGARIAKLMRGLARRPRPRADPGGCRSATTRASRPISAMSRRARTSRRRR